MNNIEFVLLLRLATLLLKAAGAQRNAGALERRGVSIPWEVQSTGQDRWEKHAPYHRSRIAISVANMDRKRSESH